MFSRILLTALMMLCGLTGAMADSWKTVESSEKKVPEWLKEGQEPGFLMVSTEAPSLQEARNLAEKELSRAVIQAVAINVNYSSSESAANKVENGDVSTTEEFSSRMEMVAAKLPFIKGVSLSEAFIYWERRENKKSKQNLYFLTAKYPMPESELEKMRSEFEKYDSRMNADYERLSKGFDSISSADEVNEGISTLTNLGEYFFDSVRLSQAETLLKRYRDVFKSVAISSERIGDCEYIVRTTLNGKPFVTGRTPKVTSECATAIKVTPVGKGDSFKVEFNNEDCLDGEINSLHLAMRLGSARISMDLEI